MTTIDIGDNVVCLAIVLGVTIVLSIAAWRGNSRR